MSNRKILNEGFNPPRSSQQSIEQKGFNPPKTVVQPKPTSQQGNSSGGNNGQK